MEAIILLTPLSRPENIPTMLDSFDRAFGDYKGQFCFTWVFVKDRWNCKEDPEPYYEQVRNSGMEVLTFESGEPQQNNYGGDLLNVALQYLFDNGYLDYDPLVYIFDDDNIIHPLLPYFLTVAMKEYPDKRGIWLSYQNRVGETYNIMRGNAFAIANSIDCEYFVNNPDPSSVVLKLAVYKDNYPMMGGMAYDYTYMRRIVENMFLCDELVLQGDLENWRDRAGTYHNGIAERKFLDNPEDKILSVVIMDGRLTPDNDGVERFAVPKEANAEIMDVLLKYGYAFK